MSSFVTNALLPLSPTVVWPLNDSGSTAVDIVAGINGAIGANWAQAASLLSAQTDGYNNSQSIPATGGTPGSSSWIAVPANAALKPATKLSVVGLYEFTGTSVATNHNLISNNYTPGIGISWNILNSGGKIIAQIFGIAGVSSTTTLVAGTRYLIGVTFDGTLSSNSVKVYLQGTLEAQAGGTSTINYGFGSGGDIHIGQEYSEGNLYTTNVFQDWAIWSGVVLSPTDMANIFAGTTSPLTQSFTAALTFAGISPKRKITHPLTAALSFVSSQKRDIGKKITAGLTFVGAIANRLNKTFAAALSFVGSTNKRTTHPFTAGLTFVGALQPQARKVFAAGLTFVGAQTRKLGLKFTAALTFVGITPKLSITRSIAAALSFVGALPRRTTRSFNAALTFTGALAANIHYSKVLAAALSFTGSAKIATSKKLVAALTFVGAQQRSIAKKLTAALSFLGSLSSSSHLSKAFSASLSFASSQKVRVTLAFSGALPFAGAIGRRISTKFNASLSFVGTFATHAGAIVVVFAASLGLSGAVRRGIAVRFRAALGFIGRLLFPTPTPPEIIIVNFTIMPLSGITLPITTLHPVALPITTLDGITLPIRE